jgi:hypothetical protein
MRAGEGRASGRNDRIGSDRGGERRRVVVVVVVAPRVSVSEKKFTGR